MRVARWVQRGKIPADVVPRGHEELLELLRECAADGKGGGVSPTPGYSRPTSASSAAGRATPPLVRTPGTFSVYMPRA